MKEVKSGGAAVYTYSPAGYLVSYRYADRDKKLKQASITKRDEQNRPKEYTRMDDRKKPLYTYWFRWKDDNTIDRERQRYRQEKGERLHIYDYLKTDDHDNWIQRLMVRYDIDSEKKKIYERLVVRTIEYFEPKSTATEWSDTVATNVTEELTTNTLGSVITSNHVAEASESKEEADSTNIETAERPEVALETGRSQEELKAEFGYTFDDLSDKLVIITCKSDAGRSYGSGFVAKMNGRTYLFTNQHVIMGADTIQFKTADGEVLEPRGIELSKTRDIARMLIQERDGFKISEKFPMGIPLGVFGNSEGAGVATELFGEVTGLGTDLVEVNAEFVSGNSGSPVLDTNQEVIGIASYVRVTWTPPKEKEEDQNNTDKDSDEDETDEDAKPESTTRRFCYRLDHLEWQPVKWKTYNRKYGKAYHKHKTFSDRIIAILKDPENFNASSREAAELAADCSTHTRQLRLLTDERELTEFLLNEFEEQIELFEYAGKLLRDYAKNRR